MSRPKERLSQMIENPSNNKGGTVGEINLESLSADFTYLVFIAECGSSSLKKDV